MNEEMCVPTNEEVWEHTKAIAGWLAVCAPEDSEIARHWNALIPQLNRLLLEAQHVRSLQMQRDQLSAALEEHARARRALEYLANLEPQGQALVRVREQLGKVRHHAQLVERRAQQAQQELSAAVEGVQGHGLVVLLKHLNEILSSVPGVGESEDDES